MANEFIARNGLIAQESSVVSGSLIVTQGITGSLFGTASYVTGSIHTSANPALSASNTLTASFVNPLNQNVIITGSLLVGTGSSLIAPNYGLTPNLAIGMNTGSTGAVLDLRNTSNPIVAGDTLGVIQFVGKDDSSIAYASSQIRATVSNDPGQGYSGGGNIAIWTGINQAGYPLTERMRVNNLGQVLIGLTSSLNLTSKLVVSGSTIVTGSLNVTQGITGSLQGTASYARYPIITTTVTGATTAGALSNTDYVYLVNGTATITLPTSIGNTSTYHIKNIGSGTPTVQSGSAGQTIEGSSTVPITLPVQYSSVTLIASASNWFII